MLQYFILFQEDSINHRGLNKKNNWEKRSPELANGWRSISSTQSSSDLSQLSTVLPHSNKHLITQIPTISRRVKQGRQDFTTVNTSMCFLHVVLIPIISKTTIIFWLLISSPILSELQHQLGIIWAGIICHQTVSPARNPHSDLDSPNHLVLSSFIPQSSLFLPN